MRDIHEINNKQETTNRIVSKLDESNMNSGNQLIVHEKVSFIFTMFALFIALL